MRDKNTKQFLEDECIQLCLVNFVLVDYDNKDRLMNLFHCRDDVTQSNMENYCKLLLGNSSFKSAKSCLLTL